jgi:lipid-A-disaccharide synthase
VVPELVQDDVSPERIADAVTPLLSDPERHRSVTGELLRVRSLLGEGGASRRAAAVVREFLGATA